MPDNALAFEPRPHAFTKAKEIALALGPEWKAMPSHPEQTMDVAWMAYLHGPDLRALTLNMGTWRAGRLTILGSAARLQAKYNDPRVSSPNCGGLPQISVDPMKDAESIAKDIKRRLLDDYEKAYKFLADNFESLKRATIERMSTVEELILLTHGRLSPNYPFSVYGKGPSLDVDSPTSIRFSHTQTFTLDQMRRLIEALPEIFR